eukprot:CAMPEP_0198240976 /NCGR_PEP_ID=MMETSP1446-20131203/5941_1 /TAXON_ID=1461542 ORGANISM="Unidentified sp, Strain CCMP2111" /NCGR_SAMPLE_ID=MMETSP1446 /ASSEMBLY_ACC=CAM_ASM_001112 /LENGTH=324 /DNA_ID=CAMNT_0043923773 /DNA_START=236 /DNA_END=1210 /DNA_ORIENTATION=+
MASDGEEEGAREAGEDQEEERAEEIGGSEASAPPAEAGPSPDEESHSSLTTLLRWPVDDLEGGSTVHILGTAHVSRKSCEQVRELIHRVKPQVVLVELCRSRTAILTQQDIEPQDFDLKKAFGLFRTGEANLFELGYGWLLSKVSRQLEVLPGEEFRVAYAEAQSCGAKFVMGDRPVKVTLERTWHALNLFSKAKLFLYLLRAGFSVPEEDELSDIIEEMKDSDVLTGLMEEFAQTFPQVTVPLIKERDLYITYHLRAISEKYSPVVAVVGAGHVPGIKQYWSDEIDIDAISKLPQASYSTKPIIYATLAIACTAGLIAFMRKR